MKGKNLFVIGLLVLLAGIVLILLHSSISATGIVVTCGVLFIFAGVLNMAIYLYGKDSSRRRGMFSAAFSWVSSAAAVILGLAMLIFEPTFAALVAFMFGVLIAFCALYQFFLLGYGVRPVPMPGWLYIIPTALAGAAIYLFVARDEALTGDQVMLVTGCSLAVFGLFMAIEGSIVGQYNRHARKAPATPAPLDSVAPADVRPVGMHPGASAAEHPEHPGASAAEHPESSAAGK